MPWFKLLRGIHTEGRYVEITPGGTEIRKPFIFKRGAVFESAADLTKKMNSQGSSKFLKITPPKNAETHPMSLKKRKEIIDHRKDVVNEGDDETVAETLNREDMETMSLHDISAYAEEKGIDIAGVTEKSDIIELILMSQE